LKTRQPEHVTMKDPRVSLVSLFPAATEIAWALSAGGRLVGRSHECDWPPETLSAPALTTPRLDPTASSREIHAAVQQACEQAAGALFSLDVDRLAALRPEVVLTQATCGVCAISRDEVDLAVQRSGHSVRVVSLSASSLSGLWSDIITVGEAVNMLPRARELVSRLQSRCDSIACRVAALSRAGGTRLRVAMIEWLDPPMAAGHWTPELVRTAGGDDCLGREGEHSHWIDWGTVAAADPDVVILSPCGFTLDRTLREAATPDIRRVLALLRATREGRLWAVDGHHLLNRPGPRLVDSLEVIATVLHPGMFDFPAARRFACPVVL
jgi:iron complex transport system substrate-binding protein